LTCQNVPKYHLFTSSKLILQLPWLFPPSWRHENISY